MFGSSRFRWLVGNYNDHFSPLTFPATLGLSDADANAGTVKRGKAMAFADNKDDEMKYAGTNGAFLGLLLHDVNKDGTKSDAGFKDIAIGKIDIPISRGSKVGLRVPFVGSIAEFEGTGTVGIDTLVVTSGTGALAAGTALYSKLTLESGAWRVAQATEHAYGMLLRANLTPENSGEVRIRVQFISPIII